ncbi:MAG TPA: HNH endonuclease signature motif containing protein [Kofleriaceae bacterium]
MYVITRNIIRHGGRFRSKSAFVNRPLPIHAPVLKRERDNSRRWVMLRDAVEESGIEVDPAPTWTSELWRPGEPRWRTVDQALRAIARRRAALDADEARWLREAEALQIWRPLGMVSALDYLERVLGYAPRTAQDRLRVARSLGDLPQLAAALARGELPFSAVRELTRVATPATEAAWVAAATGKNLRQIEELVADHRPGDHPDDPPDPEARTHVVRFELSAQTFALLRQARAAANDEHGTNLPDDAFVATLCNAVLDGAPQAEPTGRAKFQIAVTVCERCRQGWQEGAGTQIAVGAATVDRAMCDAQHIGSLDGAEPERAYQDIPPSVARLVWRRDGGRCRVPGCRSSRGLELHHLIHRADGGTHEASNLTLICSACHQSHHDGRLTISGPADRIEVQRPGPTDPESRPRDRPPSSSIGAHVDAAEVVTAVGTRAHVSATDVTTSVDTGTHMDATEAAMSAARTDAHVGARNATTSVAATGDAGATSKLEVAIVRAQAKAALIGLGWKSAIAHAAVAAAAAAHGTEMALERWIFEALRRCPAPKA